MRKENGYWNIKENVFEEAKKYKKRNDFSKGCNAAYKSAIKNGWIDEMSWFETILTPKSYWTKEKAFEEAKKYKTRRDFQKGSWSAYCVVCENGWMKELEHFNQVRMPNGYWEDKEKVIKEALKYQTRNEFHKNNDTAYTIALKNGWLDEIPFKKMRKEDGYWDVKENVLEESKKYSSIKEFQNGCNQAYNRATKNDWINKMEWLFRRNHQPHYWENQDNVFTEAHKYKTTKEFRLKSYGAYTSARKNGWLKDMVWLSSSSSGYKGEKYSIYVYSDEENKVAYVGLTSNQERRHREHTTGTYNKTQHKSAVYEYFTSKNKSVPEPKYIEENLTAKEASEREKYWHNYYLNNLHYTMLNKTECGTLGGGNYKWTKERVLNEALKYQTKQEFRKNSLSAYSAARKNKWLKDIHHFTNGNKPKFYWTKENVLEEAKKYTQLKDFRLNGNGAYAIALRNGWLSEITWLEYEKKPKHYWAKDTIMTASKECTTKMEFYQKYRRAYKLASKNGWLNDMPWLSRQK